MKVNAWTMCTAGKAEILLPLQILRVKPEREEWAP